MKDFIYDETFIEKLKEAIESGKETDWGYDGVDEYPYDIFREDIALENVIQLLKEYL